VKHHHFGPQRYDGGDKRLKVAVATAYQFSAR